MRKNRDSNTEMTPSEKKGQTPKSRGSSTKETGQIFGLIQGVGVGQTWQTRDELSRSWVHRPKFASLHAGQEGVSSILINSKYRGKDNGLNIMYSGQKVKRRGRNGIYLDSLIKNYKNKKPIRVVRGAKRNSDFAPASGFRYDGLYEVEKYWKERDHMTFSLRRLMDQNMPPPWIRAVPAKTSSESSEVLDSDFSPFISFIRCQPNRCSPPTSPFKLEQSDSDENNFPFIEIKDSDDESPEVEVNNYEVEDPPTDPVEVNPILLPHDFSEHEQNDIFVIPEILPPPDEPVEVQPSFIGGMPVPKVIDQMVKEEVTCSGLVVIETLPEQDVYEVYNESLIYEEEHAQVTEVGTDWKVEEEVDTKVARDAGLMQINNSLISHMQKLGIASDIDVEDGPKFAHFLRGQAPDRHSPDIANVIIDQRISETNENESALVQNIVKVDYNDDGEDASEETVQSQELLRQQSDELSEQNEAVNSETVDHEVDNNDGNCLYIYPGTKCESVDQAEEAILSGNFQWYQGNRPLEEPSKGFTLHEVQKMLVPDCQPVVSKQSEEGKDKEQQESSGFPSYDCQELCIPDVEKPDTTSQELDQNVKHYHSADQQCPYKDITLAEMLAFTFNESQEGCVCRWSDRLPCMNYCIQEILNARKKALNSIQEKKQIMMKPQEQNTGEKLGRISSVGTVSSSGNCQPNSVEHQDDHHLQGLMNIGNVNYQENNTSLQMVEQPPDSQINVNSQMVSLKHVEVLWRGLEEVRDEAMKRVYKMPQPIVDKDGLKTGEKELTSEEAKSVDVDEKGPKLPGWHYSERKDVFLHHHLRKRRLSNVTTISANDTDTNVPSSPSREASPPLNKVRMVQVRNIRTRINRTRIVQVNNSQLSSSSSVDREMSSDSLENIENEQHRDNIIEESEMTNKECNFNNWSTLHVINEQASPTASGSNSESGSTLERECEEFCQELELQKEVLINTNLSSPITLVVDEEEDLSLQKKEDTSNVSTSNVPIISEEKSELSCDQPLKIVSSMTDTGNKKSNVEKPQIEYLQAINNKEKLPSPDSDTTSFERTCDELCETLPRTESDIHCTLSTTTVVPTSGEVKGKRRRGRPRLQTMTSTSNITEVTSSTADSVITTSRRAQTKRSYPKKRLNVSRDLKGFTSEDITKTKRIRDVFQKIIVQYKCAYLGDSQKVATFHDEPTVAKRKKMIKKTKHN